MASYFDPTIAARAAAEAAGFGETGFPVGTYDPFADITGPTGDTAGSIILGGLGSLVNWGLGQLPARRPPSLPPARVPPALPPARLPPAGVPYPTGGGGVARVGRAGPMVARAVKIAVLAAGGYEIAGWLYDAAGTLIGKSHRRRRMNVLNSKALRRSMRRVTGFAHFARKTISFTHRVKMKRGGRFAKKH